MCPKDTASGCRCDIRWLTLLGTVSSTDESEHCFSSHGFPFFDDVHLGRPTDNLATMPGFAEMNGVAVGADGRADPQSQLFRSSALGVETGPFISQVRCAGASGVGVLFRT